MSRMLPWRRSWQLPSGCDESSFDCGAAVGLGSRRLLERASVERPPGGRADDDILDDDPASPPLLPRNGRRC